MPRSTGVPESLVPGGEVDSAGFPWAGRTFDHHDTAFADDDGTCPEAYALAIAALRSATDPAELADAHAAVLLSLSRIRLLVPLLAEAGDLGVTPDGKVVEKSQELSIVTVESPDGRPVMPVFSSVAAMQRWNPQSRPIPVPGPQAAIAAAQEGTDLIIVDAGSPETEFGVRRTQLEAMAVGTPALPAWADRDVYQAFVESCAQDPRVRAVDVRAADPQSRLLDSEIAVVLTLELGLSKEALNSVLTGLQDQWARNDVIAERVDSMRVVLRAATDSSE